MLLNTHTTNIALLLHTSTKVAKNDDEDGLYSSVYNDNKKCMLTTITQPVKPCTIYVIFIICTCTSMCTLSEKLTL